MPSWLVRHFSRSTLTPRFPVGPGLFDPGCGSLAEAIAVASGGRPAAIGKPELPLFQFVIERLGCPAHQAAMVGDSISSDIEGGKAAGMFTIWIDPENDDSQPTSADLKGARHFRSCITLAASAPCRQWEWRFVLIIEARLSADLFARRIQFSQRIGREQPEPVCNSPRSAPRLRYLRAASV